MESIPMKSGTAESLNAGVLIDVRSPAEFRSGSLPEAVNVPLYKLSESRIRDILGDQDSVCFFCTTGVRAEKAAARSANLKDIHISCLEGGVKAWQAAGKTLTPGVASFSIERQVRIAAGILILAGVGLSIVVHPSWIALSGFVGAGLIFAGITDSCMMGMLLARMPWNQ